MSSEPRGTAEAAGEQSVIAIYTHPMGMDAILNTDNDEWLRLHGQKCVDLPVIFVVRLIEPSKQMRIIFSRQGKGCRRNSYTDFNWDEMCTSHVKNRDFCKCLVVYALSPLHCQFDQRARDPDVSATALLMVSEMHRVAGKELPSWFRENMRGYADKLCN